MLLNEAKKRGFVVGAIYDSLKKKDVTLREISTMKQVRVKIDKLREVLRDLLYGDLAFNEG